MKKLVIILCFIILFSGILVLGKNQSLKTPLSKTQPVKESPVKFIVFGDSGTGDDAQKKLASVMNEYPINLFLHTGDIAYDSGTSEELQKNFFDVYASLLKKAPVYPSPGNHDYLTDNLGPYLARFAKERYYSFDKGPIHFVALDTNTPIYGNDMTAWLAADLEKVAGKKWTIVYFHHPPYSSGKVHGGNLTVEKKLVPLFEKYHVDLVLSGHEHNYERMRPINGIVYIITGGGSGTLYEMGPILDTTAFRAVQTHFMYMTATTCILEGKAINVQNAIIDTFSIKRC